MRNFEEPLRARRPFRNFDPSGEQWLGLYSVTTAALSEHKVVVREIAARVRALRPPFTGRTSFPITSSMSFPATRLMRLSG
jgi:hypothetical protein